MFSKLWSSIPLHAPDLPWPELTAEDWRTYAILAAFPLLLALEASFARREGRPRDYRQSYLANCGLLLLNDLLLSLLSISSLWLVAESYSEDGLLSGVSNPWLQAVLAFVLLDLVLYFWHRINHNVDWLWMFHKVHHSDRVMNATTAFRLHFVEVFMTVAVKALFIVAMGVKASVVMANEAIITLFVMFHHANLAFPGERWLGRLAIVPYLHRVHHSVKREEHDHNYGAVFSWWDRLFGTLAEVEPAELGLKHVPGQNLLQLVHFGFRPPPAPSPQSLHSRISEAAYFRAEKRGFAPGHEYRDWLEAEREIKGCELRP
jgi:sterol desaturase/sphingolipid hydroxylase (fatty acid hydroxylase superfamily)